MTPTPDRSTTPDLPPLPPEEVAQIEAWFTYHAPVRDQPARYAQIRESAKATALTIIRCCPPSADRTAALRKLRECVMTANASIALEPAPREAP